MNTVEPEYLICGFERYVAASTEDVCSECGKSVFISPSSVKTMSERALVIICENCALWFAT